MIQLVPQLRILLACEPVDFRKGIDGLAAVCRGPLAADPFSGALFVFRNRSGTALKLLVYDGGGYWLCLKRFSKGRLRWWPKADSRSDSTASREPLSRLAAEQLHVLLYNGDPEAAGMAEPWRRIALTPV